MDPRFEPLSPTDFCRSEDAQTEDSRKPRSEPWLSVVIPTYNGGAYLVDALEGIARQDLEGTEIIAVDDGSTDDTVAILERFSERLPLRILRRSHLGNWVANTNLGLTVASGEYACIVHQDDYWLPGRLATLKTLVNRNPEATLLLHPSWYVDEDGRRLGLWKCPLACHQPLQPSLVVRRLLVQNFIAMPAPLFRRQVAMDSGGLKPHLWYTADWDLWLTLASRGPTVYYPSPLACFRIHRQSQTIQSSGSHERFREQLDEVLRFHAHQWEASFGKLPAVVRRAAHFSVDMNTALAACFHGQRRLLPRLLIRALTLGPTVWICYLRDSRIVERAASRLRLASASR